MVHLDQVLQVHTGLLQAAQVARRGKIGNLRIAIFRVEGVDRRQGAAGPVDHGLAALVVGTQQHCMFGCTGEKLGL
ncbi:hypothetical protein D3C76_502210 [compost metagenome]